jgi:hypothetical protein
VKAAAAVAARVASTTVSIAAAVAAVGTVTTKATTAAAVTAAVDATMLSSCQRFGASRLLHWCYEATQQCRGSTLLLLLLPTLVHEFLFSSPSFNGNCTSSHVYEAHSSMSGTVSVTRTYRPASSKQ